MYRVFMFNGTKEPKYKFIKTTVTFQSYYSNKTLIRIKYFNKKTCINTIIQYDSYLAIGYS